MLLMLVFLTPFACMALYDRGLFLGLDLLLNWSREAQGREIRVTSYIDDISLLNASSQNVNTGEKVLFFLLKTCWLFLLLNFGFGFANKVGVDLQALAFLEI